MGNDLKEKFDEILETLEELDWDEIFDFYQNIDEVYWKDNYCSLTLIKKYLDDCWYDIDDYGLDFIPEYFWLDRRNALDAIEYISSFNNFNIGAYVPNYLWEDEHAALYIITLDYTGLRYVPDTLSNYQEIVHHALYGLEEKIEESYHNGPAYPWENREHFEWFMDDVSKSLNKDKDFILELLGHYYFSDEYDVIFRWIDKELWNDKDFVLDVIEICGASYIYLKKFISEHLLNDQDIKIMIE